MSVLSSLRLTPEKVRRITQTPTRSTLTAPQIGRPLQHPVAGPSPRRGGRQKPAVWFWMWLVNLDPERLFTVEDVMQACGKTRSSTVTSIHAARNHGFVVTAQRRNFNGDKSLYRRTMR